MGRARIIADVLGFVALGAIVVLAEHFIGIAW
jgi:hypothetical protein